MTQSASRGNLAILLPVLLVLVLVAGYFALPYFSWGYGKVSPLGYEYATALVSICNQKDADRLEKLAVLLDDAESNERLEPQESKWLRGIIDLGRRGDWQNASRNARRLLSDQVTYQPG